MKIRSFTKSQLLEIHRFLVKENMLPIIAVSIGIDPRYSTDKINYYKFEYMSEDNQIMDMSLITHENIDREKLLKQLISYFGVKNGQ